MTLQDLYTLVVETTGLLVVTPESLSVAVRSCYADLRGRGYRQFKEKTINMCDCILNEEGMLQFYVPTDYSQALYLKVLGEKEMKFAARAELTNPAILGRYDTSLGKVRSDFSNIGTDTIYYTKDKLMYVENCVPNLNPQSVWLGYYAKLVAPPVVSDPTLFDDVLLDIREEYEDALTQYVCYFFTARHIKDPERIQFHLKQYKYLVEDLVHALNSEDMYNEGNSVIPYEE